MKWLKKLNNPFVLGIEGFLVGAVLFFATHPEADERRIAPAAAAAEQTKAESGRSGA